MTRVRTKKENTDPGPAKLDNSDILKNLDQKLTNLDQSQRDMSASS